MKTNLLAIAALLGAPFLCIGIYVEAYNLELNQPWWTGVWGLIYITGWLAGMEVMRRLSITGDDRFGRMIIPIVMSTLVLADISNIWQLIAPSYKPFLYWIFDTCWPISHVLMLGVGIAALRARTLSGYKPWLLVAMGLWFPLTIVVSKTPVVLHFSNIYSLIVWVAVALVLLRETSMQQG